MPHPKFKFLTPHTPAWRLLRREEQQRRTIRDCDGRDRLAPGRIADPELERCLCNTTTILTEREHKELLKHKPCHMTKSTFVRFVLCQFLESKRPKLSLTKSFVEWASAEGAQRTG